MFCQGFQPIEPAAMRVLILGTMPGIASLQQQAYYAHPRNGFWPIMAQVCHQAWSTDWSQRYQQLLQHHVGLWDVVAQCQRQGSLDSSIQTQSLRVNNIVGLVSRHPQCRAIGLNGGKAQALFQKHIVKPHPEVFDHLALVTLPSSSPAYARLSLADKTKIWQDKLANFL